MRPRRPTPIIQVGHQPGKRPELDDFGALERAPGHCQHQGHRNIRGGVGQHARRVGDRDAAFTRAGNIDVIEADTKIGNQLQLGTSGIDDVAIDAVANGRNQNLRFMHCGGQRGGVHGAVGFIQAYIEQRRHFAFDGFRQFARDDDLGFQSNHPVFPALPALFAYQKAQKGQR